MDHKYTLQVFRAGVWTSVKHNLSATLACFGLALETLKQDGELWRAVRDDGVILNP